MDDKMIVVVFDNEKQAYAGFKALKDLHAEGTITLYASAVIAKDADGKVIVKEAAERGPLGTGVGLVAGSLLGLLGGPVGAAFGAYTGSLGGVLYDLAKPGSARTSSARSSNACSQARWPWSPKCGRNG